MSDMLGSTVQALCQFVRTCILLLVRRLQQCLPLFLLITALYITDGEALSDGLVKQSCAKCICMAIQVHAQGYGPLHPFALSPMSQ